MWTITNNAKAKAIVPAYATATFNLKDYASEEGLNISSIIDTNVNIHSYYFKLDPFDLITTDSASKTRCVNLFINSVTTNEGKIEKKGILENICDITKSVYLDNNYTLTTNFPYKLAIFTLNSIDTITIDYIITYGPFYNKETAIKFSYNLDVLEASNSEAGEYKKIKANDLVNQLNYPCYLRYQDQILLNNLQLTYKSIVINPTFNYATHKVSTIENLDSIYIVYKNKKLTPVFDIFDYLNNNITNNNSYYREAGKALCLTL